MNLSDEIRQRIEDDGGSYLANDNISRYFAEHELPLLQAEVEEKVQSLLKSLLIDIDRDQNTQGTAKRVAKMLMQETYKGRYLPCPEMTFFANANDLDEIYTVGPIPIRSACSHHLVPITGEAWIGVLPDTDLIGLSKFSRLCDWVMSRPQIQEEATIMLANLIEQMIDPLGLAVVVRAEHGCMTTRGVKDIGSKMVTSVMRGAFKEKPEARAEFFSIIKGQGY